ncbi:MAG TPA: rhodanese-like domain-containing protein [Anaerolineae bacterium]|jgi:rhodanese-related sulfurtransferase|nr:rhodanese-like domain-containing protein [Anaerolineae bacterium]
MSFFRSLMGGGVPAVTVQQASEMQGQDGVGALIVDVREPNEYTQLRARGAVLLPLGRLNGRVKDLPRDRELLLMCRTGGRSQNATQFLQAQGFSNVTNVSGGIVAWHAAGLPTTSGEPEPGEGEF